MSVLKIQMPDPGAIINDKIKPGQTINLEENPAEEGTKNFGKFSARIAQPPFSELDLATWPTGVNGVLVVESVEVE